MTDSLTPKPSSDVPPTPPTTPVEPLVTPPEEVHTYISPLPGAQTPEDPSKKNKKPYLIIGGVVVVALVIIGAIYMNAGSLFKGQVSNLSSISQAVYADDSYDVQVIPANDQVTSFDNTKESMVNKVTLNKGADNTVTFKVLVEQPKQAVDAVTAPADTVRSTNLNPAAVEMATQETMQQAIRTANQDMVQTNQLNQTADVQMQARTMQQVNNAVEMKAQTMQMQTMQKANEAVQMKAQTMQMQTMQKATNQVQMQPQTMQTIQKSNATLEFAPRQINQTATQTEQRNPAMNTSTEETSPTASVPLAFHEISNVAHAQAAAADVSSKSDFTVETKLPYKCAPDGAIIEGKKSYTCTVDATTLSPGDSESVTFNLLRTNGTAVVTIEKAKEVAATVNPVAMDLAPVRTEQTQAPEISPTETAPVVAPVDQAPTEEVAPPVTLPAGDRVVHPAPIAACSTDNLPDKFTKSIDIQRTKLSGDDQEIDLNPGVIYNDSYDYSVDVYVNGTLNSALSDVANKSFDSIVEKLTATTNTSTLNGINISAFNLKLKTKDLVAAFSTLPEFKKMMTGTSTKTLELKFYAVCPAIVIPTDAVNRELRTPLNDSVSRLSSYIPKANAAPEDAVEIGDLTINIKDAIATEPPVNPPVPVQDCTDLATFGDKRYTVERNSWIAKPAINDIINLSQNLLMIQGHDITYSYIVKIDGVDVPALSNLVTNSESDVVGLRDQQKTFLSTMAALKANGAKTVGTNASSKISVPDITNIIKLINADQKYFPTTESKTAMINKIHSAQKLTIEVYGSCSSALTGFLPYAHADSQTKLGSFEFDINDPSPTPEPPAAPVSPVANPPAAPNPATPAPAPTPAPTPTPAPAGAPQCQNEQNKWVLYTESSVFKSDYDKANQNFPDVLTADTLCPQNRFQRVYGALTVYRINSYIYSQIAAKNPNANVGFKVKRVADLTSLKGFEDYSSLNKLQKEILDNIYTDLKFNTLRGRINPNTFFDVNQKISLDPLDYFTLPELYSMFLQQAEIAMSYGKTTTVSFPIIDKFLPSYLKDYKQNPKLEWAARAWTYARITGMCYPEGMSSGDFFGKILDRATVASCFAQANPSVMEDLFQLTPDQVVQKYGQ